jgi:hypothetical protein
MARGPTGRCGPRGIARLTDEDFDDVACRVGGERRRDGGPGAAGVGDYGVEFGCSGHIG